MPIIGIDFDNTIVNYDRAFPVAAVEAGRKVCELQNPQPRGQWLIAPTPWVAG